MDDVVKSFWLTGIDLNEKEIYPKSLKVSEIDREGSPQILSSTEVSRRQDM